MSFKTSFRVCNDGMIEERFSHCVSSEELTSEQARDVISFIEDLEKNVYELSEEELKEEKDKEISDLEDEIEDKNEEIKTLKEKIEGLNAIIESRGLDELKEMFRFEKKEGNFV